MRAQMTSSRALCRSLFVRVHRLTVLVELRLNRLLILFAVWSVARTPRPEGDGKARAAVASKGMSPSHFVTRIVGFFICAWPFSTGQIVPCQRLVASGRSQRLHQAKMSSPAKRHVPVQAGTGR